VRRRPDTLAKIAKIAKVGKKSDLPDSLILQYSARSEFLNEIALSYLGDLCDLGESSSWYRSSPAPRITKVCDRSLPG
jgi:hypothetical protein